MAAPRARAPRRVVAVPRAAGRGGAPVRRAVLLLALLGALVVAPGASAHPLGNFSFNHLSEVSISSDRAEVPLLLDQPEIPTFQERDESTGEVIAAKRAEALEGLDLTVDGR